MEGILQLHGAATGNIRRTVSILVLVEGTLQRSAGPPVVGEAEVSILVLVEGTLQPNDA